jgi:5-methylcytosine-specific restriction endonuclease McrA
VECAAAWQQKHKDRLKLYNADWHEANRARRLEQQRARYTENRAAVLEKSKAYREQHKADYARWGAEWNAANPERRRSHWQARRARVLACEGIHTADERAALLMAQKHRCANCRASIKRGYEVDHIKPLALGGSNDIGNIQLLCMPCNRSKGASDPIEWAQQHGRLV